VREGAVDNGDNGDKSGQGQAPIGLAEAIPESRRHGFRCTKPLTGREVIDRSAGCWRREPQGAWRKRKKAGGGEGSSRRPNRSRQKTQERAGRPAGRVCSREQPNALREAPRGLWRNPPVLASTAVRS